MVSSSVMSSFNTKDANCYRSIVGLSKIRRVHSLSDYLFIDLIFLMSWFNSLSPGGEYDILVHLLHFGPTYVRALILP